MNAPTTCPYCARLADLVTTRDIYPHRPDLPEKNYWRCLPCRAWVGCHVGTTNALGRLADGPLRLAKSAVHREFDPIWKSGRMTRKEAYRRLSVGMNLAGHKCHIGKFDIETCARALDVIRTIDKETKTCET